MDDALKEGAFFGKSSAKEAVQLIKEFPVEELRPPKSQEFDAKKAKEDLKNQNIENSEILEFVTSDELRKNTRDRKQFNEDEYFIRHSDDLTNGSTVLEIPNEETSDEYIFLTCQEEGAPYPIKFTQTLQIDEVYEPEEINTVKECLGHKKKTYRSSKSSAQEWVNDKIKTFSADSTLKSYDAWIEGGSLFSDYKVKAVWTHFDDVSVCDQYKAISVTKPQKLEEKERWVCDDEALFILSRSPNCILVDRTCLDSSPKTINGKEIYKQCWREQYGFLCNHPKTKQCLTLREKACQEVERRCLKESEFGCSLWEITYKCLPTVKKLKSSQEDVFGLDQSKWKSEYEPNSSFTDVYTKIALFEEIKKDLEKQNGDATKISIFKGKEMSCDKSIAESMMYDCCFSLGGITNDLKLSKCSEKEITLAEMRENGLCHYVGKYEEEFLDLWKSRDVHVFCCFSSKLARVFQEEARNQLELDWGKPKNSDCQGFFIEDLEHMDLSKMNLSEVYDQQTPELEQRLKEKLDSIGSKIKEKIDQNNSEGTWLPSN